ncbi:MAG: PAQR family membrane homeostasis protein TrhA [Alphaproteobacteria bacterium]
MASVTRASDEPRSAYSHAELLADAAVHGAGFAGAGAAAALLLAAVVRTGDGGVVTAAVIYAVVLVAMPLVSAAHNLTPPNRWRDLLRRLDQATIFVMIAGTYTPFGLVALGGVLGHALLALIWGAAVVGVSLKLWHPSWLDSRRSVALYLALGWCALPAVGPLAVTLGPSTLTLVGLGGALYSLGVIFHLWTTLPFHNAIWHGFVVVAAGCHVFAVFDVLVA